MHTHQVPLSPLLCGLCFEGNSQSLGRTPRHAGSLPLLLLGMIGFHFYYCFIINVRGLIEYGFYYCNYMVFVIVIQLKGIIRF